MRCKAYSLVYGICCLFDFALLNKLGLLHSSSEWTIYYFHYILASQLGVVYSAEADNSIPKNLRMNTFFC